VPLWQKGSVAQKACGRSDAEGGTAPASDVAALAPFPAFLLHARGEAHLGEIARQGSSRARQMCRFRGYACA
jgi:hypothetical protein